MRKLTKQHFEFMATVLAEYKPDPRSDQSAELYRGKMIARQEIAEALCAKVAITNVLFERRKFMEACGVII